MDSRSSVEFEPDSVEYMKVAGPFMVTSPEEIVRV
jgi:hypothetical protein